MQGGPNKGDFMLHISYFLFHALDDDISGLAILVNKQP